MLRLVEGYGYGGELFKVGLGTGTAYVESFLVSARNEGDAVDCVTDYAREMGLEGLYYTLTEIDQEELEELEGLGFTSSGNCGDLVDLKVLEAVAGDVYEDENILISFIDNSDDIVTASEMSVEELREKEQEVMENGGNFLCYHIEKKGN